MNSRQLHSSEAGSTNIALFLSVFSAVFLLIVISATLITFILPETFASTARMRVTLENVGTNQSYDPYFRETQIELIKSEVVLEPVIQTLNLNTEWGKKYAAGQSLKTSETMEFLKKSVEVKPVRGTSLIDLTAFNESPEQAARIANAVAESYRDFTAKTASEATNSSITRIQTLITDHAIASQNPVRPKKALNITLGCVMGIFLGAVAATLIVASKMAFGKK